MIKENEIITTENIDDMVTVDSDNLITSGAVATYVAEQIVEAITGAIEGEY